MATRVLDAMDTAWTSLSPATLHVTADTDVTAPPGAASNRLVADAGAASADAERVLAAPVDLTGFDELRFWVRADRRADGSQTRPFFLELSYVDNGDAPGDEHRWLVPVAGKERWEMCRIGIAADRRSAISRLRLRALGGPFRCHVDEVVAVSEQPIADVEDALALALAGPLAGTAEPVLAVPAAGGANQVVVTPVTRTFAPGNRVRITGGSAGTEFHDLGPVTHDVPQNRTTLTFGAGDTLSGTVPAGTGRVAIFVPAIFEAPPAGSATVAPAIFATHLGVREDQQRSTAVTQRDSFRVRGAQVVCSVRPGARPIALDYLLVAVGGDRAEQRTVQERLLAGLSPDRPLWVAGAPAPVQTAAPVAAREPERGLDALTAVTVGSRVEVAARRELPWVQRTHVGAGQVVVPGRPGTPGAPGSPSADADTAIEPTITEPDEEEGIVIVL